MKRKSEQDSQAQARFNAHALSFWTRFEAYCGGQPPVSRQTPWLMLLVAAAPEVPPAAYGRIERRLAGLLGKEKG